MGQQLWGPSATVTSAAEDTPMNAVKSKASRSQKRLDLVQDQSVVEILNPAGDLIKGHSLDISSNGAKILVGEPLVFEQQVLLNFNVDDSEICMAAEVRWIRPQDAEWIVGLKLSEQVPDDYLEQLSRAGSIDRRQDNRIQQTVTVQAQAAGPRGGGELPRHP